MQVFEQQAHGLADRFDGINAASGETIIRIGRVENSLRFLNDRIETKKGEPGNSGWNHEIRKASRDFFRASRKIFSGTAGEIFGADRGNCPGQNREIFGG